MTTRIYTIEDIKKMLKEVLEHTEVEKEIEKTGIVIYENRIKRI